MYAHMCVHLCLCVSVCVCVCVHVCVSTVYWESFTEENIRKLRRFWDDHECFIATIFYLLIILYIVDSHHHLITLFKYFKHEIVNTT